MEQKQLYETTFIVNASIEDTQIEAVITRTQETISAHGGENIVINKWGRKRLAYPIQKKNNGFYVNIEFTAPGNVITPLERTYSLDENVLRSLTIKLDKKAIKAKLQAPTTPVAQEPVVTTTEDRAPLFEDEEQSR